jgi:RNA polymerase sigma factor (sigma-70 family)
MDEHEWLAERFEEHRGHLRAVAYRMLGSLGDADDAVQETWLRLSRSDAGGIENLAGWLTTVVARVCLDMLRSRTSRREDSFGTQAPDPVAKLGDQIDPEQDALLADSVGVALLVMLDRLAPAERVAFVLHDMFSVPFDEIADIVGRSPSAARQLASRARRRLRGTSTVPAADLAEHRKTVNAFLAALRARDFEGLVAVLDPDVVVRVDEAAARPGAPEEIRGARNWAKGAVAFSHLAQSTQLALIDGDAGLVWAPGGNPLRVLRFAFKGDKIVHVDILADPTHLRQLELTMLHNPEKSPA